MERAHERTSASRPDQHGGTTAHPSMRGSIWKDLLRTVAAPAQSAAQRIERDFNTERRGEWPAATAGSALGRSAAAANTDHSIARPSARPTPYSEFRIGIAEFFFSIIGGRADHEFSGMSASEMTMLGVEMGSHFSILGFFTGEYDPFGTRRLRVADYIRLDTRSSTMSGTPITHSGCATTAATVPSWVWPPSRDRLRTLEPPADLGPAKMPGLKGAFRGITPGPPTRPRRFVRIGPGAGTRTRSRLRP